MRSDIERNSNRRRLMKYAKAFEDVVSTWSPISVHPHRFGGREFLFGDAEVGHVHTNGIVDIPFTRPVHDLLLAEGLAEQHRWVPNSGWITFRIRSEQDITHALWLMRLSYLRYALKEATDPRRLFEKESEGLRLNPRFKSLFEPFVIKNTRAASAEPLPA
jgi:luciferase-like monooxygenase